MIVLYVVGGLLVAAFYIALFLIYGIGPILGIIGYFRVRWLRQRVAELEAKLAALGAGTPPPAPGPVPAPIAPSVAVRAIPVIPTAAPRPKFRLEGLLGGHVLGWAAAGLMLLSFAYFLAYAFQNEWVGPVGQVALGILGGAGLCAAGFAVHRRGRPLFAEMLSGCGVAVLYLSVFAGFGVYRLMPPERGVLYLTLVVGLTAALAGTYPARGMALMSLLGGLISPVLMPAESDQYVSFFGYLLVLDAAMLGLSVWRGWVWLPTVALVGVQVLFWAWFQGNYHPEKFVAVLAFQALCLTAHAAHDVLVPRLRRQPAHFLRLLDVVVASLAFAGVLTTALMLDGYDAFLPLLAVVTAGVWAATTWAVTPPRPDDLRLRGTLVALTFAFLTAAAGLRLTGGWVGVAWATLGLGLWWYGLRARSDPMRGLALVLLAMAVGQELLGGLWVPGLTYGPVYRSGYDPLSPAGRFAEPELFVPLFNRFALPPTVVVACLLAAAWQARVLLGERAGAERAVWLVLVITGIGFGWVILSTDVYRFVRTLEYRNGWTGHEAFSLAALSVSVVWALYAGLVLAAGFWRDSATLRYIALGLFALAVIKALAYDSARLDGFFRVLALFALAVVMGVGAWTYQRLERPAGRSGEVVP